jgi:hypothetical protein
VPESILLRLEFSTGKVRLSAAHLSARWNPSACLRRIESSVYFSRACSPCPLSQAGSEAENRFSSLILPSSRAVCDSCAPGAILSKVPRAAWRLPDRLPAQRSPGRKEQILKCDIKQRLALKFRSLLRVICATPFRKRPRAVRPVWFICCVCRVHR